MHEPQQTPRRRPRWELPALIAALLAAPVMATPAMAAFPGSNGRIAFSGDNQIRTVEADGSNLQTLTAGTQPAWSADSRKLAYRHQDAIHTIDADGSDATRISTPSLWDERPSWSPDGTEVAYSKVDFGGTFLDIAKADGSGTRTIFVGFKTRAGAPVWSPDGERIAFERSGDVAIVDADGTGELTVIPLVPGPGDAGNHTLNLPDWSPDGTKLVLQRGADVTGPDGPADSDIVVVNADGSGLQVLTANTTPNAEPVWSPDGTKILYSGGTVAQGGDGALHTINPDGSDDTKLPFGGSSPDWGPRNEPCATPVSRRLANLEQDLGELPAGLRRSLAQKLEQAAAALRAGNPGRARRMLDAFRREVRAQAGKKISPAGAEALIAAANAAKQAIGC